MKSRVNEWLQVSVEQHQAPATPELDLVLTPSIEEAAQQFNEVSTDMDALFKMNTSLEHYMQVLEIGVGAGGIAPETARSIMIGMESMDLAEADDLMISQEAFDSETSRLSATQISLEKVADTLKDVGRAIMEALKKLFDMLYELWTAVTGGAERAKRRLAGIKEKIKAAKGTPKNNTITLGGGGRLSIGPMFVGDDPSSVAEITDVAEYIYKVYPKEMEGFVDAVITDYTKFKQGVLSNPAGRVQRINAYLDDEFPALVKRHLKPIPKSDVANQAELPSQFRVPGAKKSKTLAGNYALVQAIRMTTGRGAANVEVHEIAAIFSKVYKVGFVHLAVNRKPTETKYPTPKVSSLDMMADELDDVLDMVIGSKDTKAIYVSIQKKIRDAVNKVVDNTTTARERMEGTTWINVLTNGLVKSLLSIGKAATAPNGQFNGYVVSTCNAYMAVLEHSLNQYEGATGQRDAGRSNTTEQSRPALGHTRA